MKLCPTCSQIPSDPTRQTCPHDGSPLIESATADASPTHQLTGSVVADRYEVLERIGSGGMGTVFRARQRGLERHIALKVLRPELSADQETITRFHREARAMSLLTHPNTVRVFDFGGTPNGLLYLGMELLEGELLTERIEREGRLDAWSTAAFLVQILASLNEAHSKGIIHRDLKPDNIFLARVDGHSEPVVKVLDFGIAKIVHGDRRIDQLETQAGMVFGTPRYMSPEQAQGQNLDLRTDLYSVGVLAYHMLSGAPPFIDDDAVIVMAKHIRERPQPFRSAVPEAVIPRKLERVVLQALEKNRDQRFRSAQEFGAAINATREDIRRGRPRGRRRPLLWALGAASLLFVASLVTAAYLAVGDRASTPANPSNVSRVPRSATPPVAGTPEDEDLDGLTRIESIPSGAAVSIDGTSEGTTPVVISDPPGPSFDVTVQLAGHTTTRTTVRAGESRTIELVPMPSRRRNQATAQRRRPQRRQRPPPRTTPQTRMNTVQRPAMDRNPTTMTRPPTMEREPVPVQTPATDPYERW